MTISGHFNRTRSCDIIFFKTRGSTAHVCQPHISANKVHMYNKTCFSFSWEFLRFRNLTWWALIFGPANVLGFDFCPLAIISIT